MRPVAAALSPVLSLAAAPAAPRQATACALSAYVIDQDPNGLNVRAAPSAGARLLRTVSNAASLTTCS
jgi:hypothetical protein